LKQFATTHTELADKITAMEKKYDAEFLVVFQAIKKLLEPPSLPPKRRIGFRSPDEAEQ
jgi:hypothetical protein